MNNMHYRVYNDLKPYNIGISLRSAMHNEGDMSHNDEENENNRSTFFENLHLGDRVLIHNRQVHSKRIVEAKAGNITDADGLITDKPEYALYILTADCFNIFFSTEGGRRFGIVHAGWKGILNGIVSEMRRYMKQETKIVIGQGICAKHFEVQNDVREFFEDKYGSKHIEKQQDSYLIDLRSIIIDTLKNSGDIHNIDLCNVCNRDELFSFREGDTLKRNMSIIWRADA